MPTVKKWEYHVEQDVVIDRMYAAHYLEPLGEAGWEMMSCVKRQSLGGDDLYTIVFRRRKDDQEAAATDKAWAEKWAEMSKNL